MKEGALHRPLALASGDVDLIARTRIPTGPVHRRRERAGRRIEILNLVGREAPVAQALGELDRLAEAGAGMGRNEIRQEVLFEPRLASRPRETFGESPVGRLAGFPHEAQHGVGHVLGGNAAIGPT